MSVTKRQKIVDAVIARLSTISVEAGYETDLGARVEEWPVRFDESEVPAVGVYDLPDEITKDSLHSRGATHRLKIQVRIFTAKGARARDLRQMIGDVVRGVGEDILWGGLAMDTEPNSEGLIIPTEAMEVAGAAIEFTVVYNTATFDPYF